MKRKNRPAPPSATAATADRLAAIVEAAEKAAVTVIDDAEKQAKQRLEAAEATADRLVAERLGAIGAEVDALVSQAEDLRIRSEHLFAALRDVQRRLAGGDGVHGSPLAEAEPVTPAEGVGADEPIANHLSAVAAVEEPRVERRVSPAEELAGPVEEAAAPPRVAVVPDAAEVPTPAGARLLATQMAVSGNSRAEIDARLRHGFEIDDTAPILDAILGPEG